MGNSSENIIKNKSADVPDTSPTESTVKSAFNKVLKTLMNAFSAQDSNLNNVPVSSTRRLSQELASASVEPAPLLSPTPARAAVLAPVGNAADQISGNELLMNVTSGASPILRPAARSASYSPQNTEAVEIVRPGSNGPTYFAGSVPGRLFNPRPPSTDASAVVTNPPSPALTSSDSSRTSSTQSVSSVSNVWNSHSAPTLPTLSTHADETEDFLSLSNKSNSAPHLSARMQAAAEPIMPACEIVMSPPSVRRTLARSAPPTETINRPSMRR